MVFLKIFVAILGYLGLGYANLEGVRLGLVSATEAAVCETLFIFLAAFWIATSGAGFK